MSGPIDNNQPFMHVQSYKMGRVSPNMLSDEGSTDPVESLEKKMELEQVTLGGSTDEDMEEIQSYKN